MEVVDRQIEFIGRHHLADQFSHEDAERIKSVEMLTETRLAWGSEL